MVREIPSTRDWIGMIGGCRFGHCPKDARFSDEIGSSNLLRDWWC